MTESWLPAPCANVLAEARRHRWTLETLPLGIAPRDEAEAYTIQHRVLAQSGDRIAGWKAGAKGADAPINGGLLPARGVLPSGSALVREQFQWVGLELEIAFLLNRDFPAQDAPYDEATVLASIEQMLPTIELVTSRIRPNPENPRIWAIADLLNHGALVIGQPIPYRPDYPFLSPEVSWTYNGQNVRPAGPAANPAGDPRRLLAWTVNHCCAQGLNFTRDMVITAGTYTGVFKPTEAGEAVGHFADLGEVRLTLR